MDGDLVVGMGCLEVGEIHKRMENIDRVKRMSYGGSRTSETKVPPPPKKARCSGSCL